MTVQENATAAQAPVDEEDALWNEALSEAPTNEDDESTPQNAPEDTTTETKAEAEPKVEEPKASETLTNAPTDEEGVASQDTNAKEGKAAETPPEPQQQDMTAAEMRAQLSTHNGRIAALQRELAKAQAAPAFDPKMLEEMPEVADVVQKMVESRLAPMQQRLDQFGQLTQAQAEASQVAQQAEQYAQEMVLTQAHPDWREAIGDAEKVNRFLNDPMTPQGVVRAFQANESGITDAAAAAQFVSAFKAFQGETQPASSAQPAAEPTPQQAAMARKRERQLSGAATVSSKSTPTISGPLGPDADEDALWEEALDS